MSRNCPRRPVLALRAATPVIKMITCIFLVWWNNVGDTLPGALYMDFRGNSLRRYSGRPNQSKVGSWTFRGANLNQNSMWIVLVFPRKNTRTQKRWNSWTFCFGAFLVWFAGATPDSCGFWWHSLGKSIKVHHNSQKRPKHPNYDGSLWVLPRIMILVPP